MVKRSSDQMESSPADECTYVYSAAERRILKKLAAKRPKFRGNYDLDINTKTTAIIVAPSVVSLVCLSGEQVVSQSSGTIIETQENNNTVITSLNLVRLPTQEHFVQNRLADNLKIIVRASDENSYLGEIVAYDFHYNVLVVKFKSKNFLKSANIRMIDDDFSPDRSFTLRPHSFKIKPGDPIVVVGRHFYKPFDLMAAPGIFSMDHCSSSKYDCRELLSFWCRFRMCGDGAPVVNVCGEVIGITFYELGNTSPLLPINVACKWWDYNKKHKESCHPAYGFEGKNVYLTALPTLERVMTISPGSGSGVLVEKVVPGSYAESAGLLENDVITKCDGRTVKGFFELWSCMWDKVGDVVELEVVSVDHSSIRSISMVVGEAKPLNKWPRFEFK